MIKPTILALVCLCLLAACGRTGTVARDGAVDGLSDRSAEVAGDTFAQGADAATVSSIVGSCTADSDCLAVLDYRAGFTCWLPVAAARANLDRDACLVRWRPDPRCTTAAPAVACPSGLIPVDHSCFLFGGCLRAPCVDGKCTLSYGTDQCDEADAGLTQNDCDTLKDTYLNALAAAQVCYPPVGASACRTDLTDACGCPAPYDFTGQCGDTAIAAYQTWRNANCPLDDCGVRCKSPSEVAATCAADATGSSGTCVLQ